MKQFLCVKFCDVGSHMVYCIKFYCIPAILFYVNLFQALHHRQKSAKHRSSHHDHDNEGEVSRTPEDSVCSVEGPSAIFNDGPSVAYSELGYPASRK
jgi:hypothetical protein